MAKVWMDMNIPGFNAARNLPGIAAKCDEIAQGIAHRAEAMSHGTFEVTSEAAETRHVATVRAADPIAIHACLTRNVLEKARP